MWCFVSSGSVVQNIGDQTVWVPYGSIVLVYLHDKNIGSNISKMKNLLLYCLEEAYLLTDKRYPEAVGRRNPL